MVMGYRYLPMEIDIEANISLEDFMEEENISGGMDHAIKEISFKGIVKEWESGNPPRKEEMYTLGNTKRIKNVDMDDITGTMTVYTRELSLMT
jgi:hypothetical protein